MIGLLKRLGIALATGYVLMFYSESLFWARFKPGDTFGELAVTWLFYSLAAYAFLTIVAVFRVNGLWAVFLAGALYGWLVEGVIVQTMYDALPWQISWTGLAWHALISVVIGWYWLPKLLRLPQPIWSWLVAAALGLFLGFWGMFWWVEEPETIASIPAFAGFAIVMTFLLVIGYGMSGWLLTGGFSPSRGEVVVLGGIFGLYFVFVTIPAAPLAAFVLPPLLAVLFVAFWRHRRAADCPHLLESPIAPFRWRNLLGLAALPLTAIPFYALALAMGTRLPTGWVVYLCATPLGAGMFLLSLGKLFRRRATPRAGAELMYK